MNKADKAESLFRTGYNCSQSVYAAFAEELGITVEEAAKKASPVSYTHLTLPTTRSV